MPANDQPLTRSAAASSAGRDDRTGGNGLAARLAVLAREFQGERTVEDTLRAIVRAAVDTVPGAWHAGITEIEGRRRVSTPAATGEVVQRIDRAQYETREGPCLTSAYTERTVRLPDMATEERWPKFIVRARELGVGSMLSFQLYVARDNLGALNLYACEPHAFTDESERVGLLFAAHAAVAVADARRLDQLSRALDVRDLIGQAKGILMERHRLTGDQAFQLLVTASQRINVKLVDVARELVETGELSVTDQPEKARAGRAPR
ncbi:MULTISPECIES: GAF and ANTAR domain-containing protein [unclassified Micromonospora]|uniref:GAF and ANTAR domain-containing protein n=1 Tax=unclassified Micromonospora TaxID=2617518 RepID=UPI002FEF4DE0